MHLAATDVFAVVVAMSHRVGHMIKKKVCPKQGFEYRMGGDRATANTVPNSPGLIQEQKQPEEGRRSVGGVEGANSVEVQT